MNLSTGNRRLPATIRIGPYAIMYTSGTTGRPKGVIVSHRMLRLSGEAVAMVSAARDGDVMFMWEPLFHIGGAQMIVLPLIRKVELALVERFSASQFWSQVKAVGASHNPFPRRHPADSAEATAERPRSHAWGHNRMGRRVSARSLAALRGALRRRGP